MAGTTQAIPATATAPAQTTGWLVGSRFDLMFLLLPALLAVGVGLGVSSLSLDATWSMLLFLWLLGQPHLMATFARAGLDRETRREFRYHLFVLPVIILACTVTIGFTLGSWLIVAMYFYWQSWHFIRQSYGVERLYARKAGKAGAFDWVTWGVIYIIPVIGVLRRSHQNYNYYLGMEIEWIPVPTVLMHVGTFLLLALLAMWVSQRLIEYRRGELRLAHTVYMLSHIGVFGFAFFLTTLPDHGWLIISIWHSLQYVMVVWLFNKKRASAPDAPKDRAFRWFGGGKHWALYGAFCLLVAAIVFQSMPALRGATETAGLPKPWLIALAIGMMINFHHYSLDAVVWKLRKKKVRSTMGVS